MTEAGLRLEIKTRDNINLAAKKGADQPARTGSADNLRIYFSHMQKIGVPLTRLNYYVDQRNVIDTVLPQF